MNGRTVAHYRITANLREGGMGEVHPRRRYNACREVVIQILPPPSGRMLGA